MPTPRLERKKNISPRSDTISGRLLEASADFNADFFWGLRGGGGNFGVVNTSLNPLGMVLGGKIVFPLKDAKQVLRFYRDWSSPAPDELRADATLICGPKGPALAIIVCYCGELEKGEELMRPLRSCASPLPHSIAPVPYATVQNILTPIFQPGSLHYWKAGFVRAIGDDAIEAIVDFFIENVPSFFAAIAIEQMDGAIRRVGAKETAFGHQDASHSILVLRIWRTQQIS